MVMNPTVSFCTLGCRVNQYESSAMSAALEEDGFTVVPFGDPCDVCIVNTCTVTSESDRKSRQMIRRAAKYSSGNVIVCGCFAEVSADSAAAIDGVIAVIGNKNKSAVTEAAKAAASGTGVINADKPDGESFESCDNAMLLHPGRVRSFIKVEDGCEGRCAYCIIPKARGPVRSKSPELVLREAAALAAAGSPEVILTGIEISAYGADLPRNGDGSRYDLSYLIRNVANLTDIRRIAMGSLDPTLMTDAFLARIAEVPELVRHFHLSLQSGSSATLARMRRRYNADQAMRFIEAARRYFPDAMLSADVIVGFPGESEADFLDSARFCEEAELLNLHIFPYSVRRGTAAAEMDGQIPEDEKRRRAEEMERMHEGVRSRIMSRYADRKAPVHVLFERSRGGILSGHSENFVELEVPGDESLVGRICRVMPNADGTGVLYDE